MQDSIHQLFVCFGSIPMSIAMTRAICAASDRLWPWKVAERLSGVRTEMSLRGACSARDSRVRPSGEVYGVRSITEILILLTREMLHPRIHDNGMVYGVFVGKLNKKGNFQYYSTP